MRDKIPQESETIKVRHALKIAEKIKQAGGKISGRKAWWSNGPLEFFSLSIVFFLNLYLVLPYFGKEAIDVSFSGPVIPLLGKLIVLIFQTPLLYSVQIIYILAFLIFPFPLYFFIKKVTGRKLAALASALIATLPIYLFAQTRLSGMFFDVEGPHITSLTIMPVAIYGLLSFIKEGGAKNLLMASIFSALIALTSPFGFMTYLIFAGITIFSEILLGNGRLKIVRFLIVLLFAGGLSSFWYNPSFFIWMITGPMGEEIRKTIFKLIPISFFAIPVLGTFGYLLFDRKPSLQPVFLAGFCTIAFGIISLVGDGFIFTGSPRYLSEFGISLSFLIGVVIYKLADMLRFLNLPQRFRPIMGNHLSDSFTTMVILSVTSGIVLVRNNMFLEDNDNVLGVWTNIAKGNVWLARDSFQGIHAFVGFAITLVTILAILVVARRGTGLTANNKYEKV